MPFSYEKYATFLACRQDVLKRWEKDEYGDEYMTFIDTDDLAGTSIFTKDSHTRKKQAYLLNVPLFPIEEDTRAFSKA